MRRQPYQPLNKPHLASKGLVKVSGFILTITALHFSQHLTEYSFWYDRERITNGEVWLVLTGHLVHVNAAHHLLNVLFILVLTSLSPRYVRSNFITIMASVTTLTSIFIYIFEYQLVYYAGMSGALHGMAIVIAISLMRLDTKVALALLTSIVLKVFIEAHWSVDTLWTSDIIGIRVSTESHLWGTISGFLVAAASYGRLKSMRIRA